MKKRIKMVLAAAPLLLLCLSLAPQNRTLCEGFLPENDLKIPVGDIHALGISEEAFNKVMDRAQELYEPIIAERGGTLVIKRLWSNPTVNASAQQSGGNWVLNMYGGLARHAAVTTEGFALVVCHELGHHLGGFPKYSGGLSWASNEGSSDYFATLKCLRKVLPSDSIPENTDAFAAKTCQDTYPEGTDRNLCLANSLAGSSIAKLFQALRGQEVAPAFNTPDVSVVEKTYDGHPGTQCRLDTYFQGALCTKPVSEDVSQTSPAPGACTASQGFTQGLRPVCWYHPAEGEAIAAAGVALRPASLPSEKALNERLQALRGALSGGGR
jgi:hypothetical protein